MQLTDYHFDLPAGQIAQFPLERREASRMLIVDRSARTFRDDRFSELPGILRPGDLLVVNNTRVIPARLIGQTETGARVEIFLIEEVEELVWTTLARPGRRLKAGKTVTFPGGLECKVVEKYDNGKVLVNFSASMPFNDAIETAGRTPLPPYIRRGDEGADTDSERYQTIFARNRGAIAAPTAGLHFSEAVFEKLRKGGIEIAEITLHVGYGTFEPVRETDLSRHSVAAERFEIGESAAGALSAARREGRRIIAVGTTTTRTLEYAAARYGNFEPVQGRADLTIRPGYEFRAIDGLLTNFHLPESSLLILVATFGGYELIMGSYRHAVAAGYRFYSYGDCMLIL